MRPVQTESLFAEFVDDLKRQTELNARRMKQSERSKLAVQRSDQLAAGKCSIRPLPRVATQPFRTELSIEKNSLFVSNQYKGEFFERSWEAKHPESGEPIARRVLVGKVHSGDRPRGVLTQVHQDVFYQLLQVWGELGYKVAVIDGRPYGHFKVSAYELVTKLRNDNSASTYRRVQELLRDLVSIPIVLENEYTWQGLVDREEFSLLNEVRWNERKLDRDTGLPAKGGISEVSVLFSSRITEGFLNKHIKMLLGDPYRKLGASQKGRRGEVARLLYPFLDAQLSSKDEYHIRLTALMERFGLTHYAYKSKRREKIESSIRMLDKKLILGERYVLHVRLEEAKDGDDFVLVARREQQAQRPLWKVRPRPAP